jgi:signal transduction histidine kinase
VYKRQISGSLDLLAEKFDPDPMQKKVLDLARDSVRNATSLTQEVILLSKLREKEPELENMEIGVLLEDCLEHARSSFPEVEIELIKNVTENYIRAEPIIKELFCNILHNAIRLQENRPWIRIETITKNGIIRIGISDKGPGIPDVMKRGIFNRFGTKGEKTRIGMGLSIVKTLSERFGGTVWVEDRVEGDHTRGARFVIELPVVK